MWDPRQKDKPVANMTPAEGQEGRDCWCVAFGRILHMPPLYVYVVVQFYPWFKFYFLFFFWLW